MEKLPGARWCWFRKSSGTTVDAKGDTLIYACGDLDYPAAGRMPRGGVYFDNEDRAPAYDEDNYDINDNLEEFQVFTEGEIDWLKKQGGAASRRLPCDYLFRTGNHRLEEPAWRIIP